MPLVAKGLSFSYPGARRPVVDGLSLDVSPGQVVALCGAARSGRSTVLSLLAGLATAQQGSVTADGVPVAGEGARGRVGLLLQNADEALFGLSVREDVMFAPRQLDVDREEAQARAEEALRAVQLDPRVFGQRSPFSLSGGQRRRAAMAGVMAMRPTYLLLDEPFAGLDPQGRQEIATVIHGIVSPRFGEHTGILVALSDLDLALAVADALAIMHEGRLAWHGAVADFVAAPPDVAEWGLDQPALVELAARLRDRGWTLPVGDASPHALAVAIAAHRQGRQP